MARREILERIQKYVSAMPVQAAPQLSASLRQRADF